MKGLDKNELAVIVWHMNYLKSRNQFFELPTIEEVPSGLWAATMRLAKRQVLQFFSCGAGHMHITAGSKASKVLEYYRLSVESVFS